MTNIVITVENDESYYAYIALTSLFENTNSEHSIFLIYTDIDKYKQFGELAAHYKQKIYFISNEEDILQYEDILNNYPTFFLSTYSIVNVDINDISAEMYEKNIYSALEKHRAGMSFEELKLKRIIIDFSEVKPLESSHAHIELEKLWWYYAKKTSIYRDIREMFMHNTFMEMQLEKQVNSLKREIGVLRNRLEKIAEENQQLVRLLS